MKLAFYNAWQPDSTFLDKVIATFSHGRYSHVELVFDDGEWFSISPREGHARFKFIQAKKKHWEFITLEGITTEENASFREIAEGYKGKKYDYIGAIFSIAPFCIQKESRLFCSEVCTDILRTNPRFSFLEKGCKYSLNELWVALKKHGYPGTL